MATIRITITTDTESQRQQAAVVLTEIAGVLTSKGSDKRLKELDRQTSRDAKGRPALALNYYA